MSDPLRVFRPRRWQPWRCAIVALCVLALLQLTPFNGLRWARWLWIALLWAFLLGPSPDLPVPTVVVEPDGLRVYFGFRPTRFRFAAITRVTVRGNQVGILAGEQALLLDDRLADWQELRDLVLAAVLPQVVQQVEPTGEVTPEQLEAWLEVAPGAVLRCRPRRRWLPTLGVLVVCSVCAAAAVGSVLSGHGWLEALSCLALLGVVAWRLLPITPVAADRHGLQVGTGRRARRVAWSDILTVNGARSAGAGWPDYGWQVMTTGGPLRIDHRLTQLDRLIRALQNANDAAHRGAVLPAGEDVPDSAISLHRLTDPQVERGISIATDEPDSTHGAPDA